MKKLFLFALFVFSTLAYGQKLVVTPLGLRDADDVKKTYVVVSAEGKTAKQLYDNAEKYVNKSYHSPEDVIKGKIEGEYLRFITHISDFLEVNNSGVMIPTDADYAVELNFKDGKAKIEISSLDIYSQKGGYKVLFSGGAFQGYPIYDKKGNLKRPDTKLFIESYFNSQLNTIAEFLSGKSDTDNW